MLARTTFTAPQAANQLMIVVSAAKPTEKYDGIANVSSEILLLSCTYCKIAVSCLARGGFAMARYKIIDRSSKFLPVDPSQRLLPGTSENGVLGQAHMSIANVKRSGRS